MSELYNAPYAASNQKVLRSALKNRKLADQIIKQIYDLQLYTIANGGTISKPVMSSSITPSTSSPYAIDSVKISKQLAKALANASVACRMLNVIRELQVIAGITPIIPAAVTVKSSPFGANVLRSLISSLANKKLGALIQGALYELQDELSQIEQVTLTCGCDVTGVAGDKTVTGDGIKTLTTLIGAGYTATVGGAEKPMPGITIALTGGVNDIPAVHSNFTGTVAGITTAMIVNADVGGVAGNVTLIANSVKSIATLISDHNIAFPGNTLTLAAGIGTEVPSANIVLTGGLDAHAADFTGSVTGITTAMTVNADVAGAAGNVTLTADSVKSITTLISDHNTAFPGNTLTLAAGIGTEVPSANIVLATGTNATAAVGTLDITTDIILTSVATGAARNTTTLTTQVLAAAANPTDTVLVDFTGTAAAIVCTVTPNDGTNNAATPVNLTSAELVELINSGTVVGKNITLTDVDSRRVLQTATGGDATNLVDSGEGDGVVATFATGADATFATYGGQVASVLTSIVIDADVAGAAGNVTLTQDGVTTVAGLIAAHNIAFPANTLTLTSGIGTQIPTQNIVLANGVTLHAADFTGQVTSVLTSIAVDADVGGVAGDVTLTADSVKTVATLIADHNIAFPANTLTLSAGIGTQIPSANISLIGGVDLIPGVKSSFTGIKPVVGVTALSQPMFE